MQRIMIIGGSGAGKSTLAIKLGEILGLPVIHADQFQFREGWEMRSFAERNQLMLEAISREEWIFDGNYSSTWNERIKRADTLIFLDVSRHTRLWRVLARSFWYFGRNRPDMPPGCNERFDWAFLKWTWDYDTRGRDNALDALESAKADKTVMIFRSAGEVETWLSGIGRQMP